MAPAGRSLIAALEARPHAVRTQRMMHLGRGVLERLDRRARHSALEHVRDLARHPLLESLANRNRGGAGSCFAEHEPYARFCVERLLFSARGHFVLLCGYLPLAY